MENLYQKYNPQTLDAVVGHKRTVAELKQRAKDGNFSNVMLFSGDSGVGKTVLSRIIAKYILCETKDENGQFCNECSICNGINKQKQIVNFQEFNGSNIGIDEMRQIVDASSKKMAFGSSNKKVFYLDELQEISSRSRPAEKNLLKILEKPNPNTYWILGTMDIAKISKAIINRATPYRLSRLDPDSILERMIYICENEGVELKTEDQASVLTTIAYNCAQSMRTAISLLERVIYSDLWTEDKVYDELDLLSDDKIVFMVNDILTGNMDFFGTRISRDQIENIYKVLFNVYKKKLGIELNPYEQSKIKGVKNVDLQKIESTLKNLETVFENRYLSDTTMLFHILKVINMNRGSEIKEQQPERRRRRV